MRGAIEQALGGLIVLTILADIFLTVLYARAGTGIISNRLSRLIWLAFREGSRGFGRRRAAALSLGGPIILLSLLLVWFFGLSVGSALILHPKLGTSIQTQGGGTPTDFVTAMYVGGASISVVGSSDFKPQTTPFRLLYLFNSLVGTSVVSLTLTYLMQVYGALRTRNALALKLDLLAGETADAAELIRRLGPSGEFQSGYSNLSDIAAEITDVKETHHFYPVLFYFRFHEPRYSVSRVALLALDAVSLIETALDDDRYGWLNRSASVGQLAQASLLLAETLERAFIPGGLERAADYTPDETTRNGWKARYLEAVGRLREAGISTVRDARTGADAYVSARARWDPHIRVLAPTLAYRMAEIDPVGSGAAAR